LKTKEFFGLFRKSLFFSLSLQRRGSLQVKNSSGRDCGRVPNIQTEPNSNVHNVHMFTSFCFRWLSLRLSGAAEG